LLVVLVLIEAAGEETGLTDQHSVIMKGRGMEDMSDVIGEEGVQVKERLVLRPPSRSVGRLG
jgi:hypothetical protein